MCVRFWKLLRLWDKHTSPLVTKSSVEQKKPRRLFLGEAAPALGWVEGLKVEGQGALETSPEGVWVSQRPHPFCITRLLILSLPRFTVTTKIDHLAGLDYSLMGAPQATDQTLDVIFKVRVLGQGLERVQPRRGIPSAQPFLGASCSTVSDLSLGPHGPQVSRAGQYGVVGSIFQRQDPPMVSYIT